MERSEQEALQRRPRLLVSRPCGARVCRPALPGIARQLHLMLDTSWGHLCGVSVLVADMCITSAESDGTSMSASLLKSDGEVGRRSRKQSHRSQRRSSVASLIVVGLAGEEGAELTALRLSNGLLRCLNHFLSTIAECLPQISPGSS